MDTRKNQYSEIIQRNVAAKHLRPPEVPFIFKLIRLAFKLLSPIFPKYAVEKAYLLFTTPLNRAKHYKSDSILEKVEISEFMYGKRLLKMYQWGKAEKTVILAHGWDSRGTALRSFVPGLLEKGFQVVAFDGPAHGDSPGRRLNLPVFVGVIKTVLNKFDHIEAIIGHSFGGGSSLYTLMAHRPLKFLPKLILIAAPINIGWVVEDFLEKIGMGKRAKELYKEKIVAKMGLPWEMADANNYFADLPIGRTVIFHDKNDHSVPFSLSKDFFERQKGVDLIATQGMGHFQIVKNPEVIKKVVDVIAQSELKASEAI